MLDVFTVSSNLKQLFKVHWLFLAVLATLVSCQSLIDSGAESEENTMSINLTTSINSATSTQNQVFKALGLHTDITSVKIDVKEGETVLISGQLLDQDPNGNYSGTVSSLPVGPGLTFYVHAYNTSGTKIYEGAIIQTLESSNNSFTVPLSPIDDGEGISIPSISKIEYLKDVQPLGTSQIKIFMEAAEGETLNYLVTAATGGGSFSLTSGTIQATRVKMTLITTYTAPATNGTYGHTLKLTNNQGNSITIHFETIVSDDISEVSVLFYPVVQSLGGKRIGNDIYWNAAISDDSSAETLSYSWTFSGSLGFDDNTANPAKMLNYTTDTTGDLQLTVTDENSQSATLNYSLTTNQFPDKVDIEVTSTFKYLLPDSGQVQSYTSTAGENSDNTRYTISYIDNGDDTVTDNLTYLMWQQSVDLQRRSQANAMTYCNDLSLAEHNDWRLPNLLELKDTIHYGMYTPAIDSSYFNTDENTYNYWTSDPGQTSGHSWKINFSSGTTTEELNTHKHYTRCARGRTVASGNLTDNTNNTISDELTDLMWQKSGSEVQNWENALTYCENLSFVGYTDWRLPNVKELMTIVDITQSSTKISGVFSDTTDDSYWSNTTRVDSVGYAWSIDFGDARIGTNYKIGTAALRCVRSEL